MVVIVVLPQWVTFSFFFFGELATSLLLVFWPARMHGTAGWLFCSHKHIVVGAAGYPLRENPNNKLVELYFPLFDPHPLKTFHHLVLVLVKVTGLDFNYLAMQLDH